MLEIQINNNILELPEDFSLMLEFRNPMFNDIGDFSFPFKILATVVNQFFLGFPERINNDNSAITFDTKVYFSHYLFMTGTSVFMKYIMEGGKKYYYLKFLLSRGNFNFLAKKNLRDVDYGSEIDLGATQAAVITEIENNYIVKNYPDVDCNFPETRNDDFYGDDINGDFDNFINYYDHAFSNFHANTINEDPTPDNINTLVPYPYLFFVLKKALGDIGFNSSGDFWSHEELSTLLIHNNFALDAKVKKYFTDVDSSLTPYVVPNVSVKIKLNNEIEDDDGCFNIVTYQYTTQNKGYHEIQISIKVTYVGGAADYFLNQNLITIDTGPLLNGLYTSINFVTYIDAGEVGDVFSLHIWLTNGGTLNNVRVKFNNTSYSNLNRLTKNINFQNHIPNINIKDMIKAIEFIFGFKLFPNNINKEVKLFFLKDILSSIDYIDVTEECDGQVSQDFDNEKSFNINFDWSGNDDRVSDNFKDYSEYEYLGEYDIYDDLPEIDKINQIALVKNANWIYISKVNDILNYYYWSYLTDNFLDFIYNDTKNIITENPEVSPVLMYLRGNVWIHPVVLQKGTSEAFDTGINEFAFRLLFYRGMQPDHNSNDYPLGSITRLNSLGDSVGAIELRWAGDYGLVETFLKEYLYWYVYRRRRAYANIQFSISQIAHLEFWKKIRIQEKYYFLDVIKLKVSKYRVHKAQCSLFTV